MEVDIKSTARPHGRVLLLIAAAVGLPGADPAIIITIIISSSSSSSSSSQF